jgi:hypothetical protein
LSACSHWQILPRQPEVRALIRRRLSLIARVLSLALLVGQLGAEAHAYSHLSDDSKGWPGTSQSCRACLSFAPVQAAVGGSPKAFVAAPCTGESYVPLDETLVLHAPSHRAFQSRAPPVLF